jgi:hypothetical protein
LNVMAALSAPRRSGLNVMAALSVSRRFVPI